MIDELARIEALPKEMLVPADVCKVLGCAQYAINVATRDGKNPFPFPVAVKVLGADLSLRPYGPPPSSEGGNRTNKGTV